MQVGLDVDINIMNSSSDTCDIINQLNAEEVHRLVPAFVFLVILIITGSIGNSLVFYVYSRCYGPSNIKYFILCLSGIDLFTCTVVISLEIAIMTMQYTFKHSWLCKTSRFLNTLVTMTSTGLLLLIAIDRFRKMCKPFGWQIRLEYVKFLCGLCLFLSTIYSWPAIIIFGLKTFKIPGQDSLEGTECSIDDSMKETIFPFISSIVMFGIFIIGMVSMTILYCLIGFAIRSHAKRMPKDFRAITKRTLKKINSASTIYSNDITVDSERSQSINKNFETTLSIKRDISMGDNSHTTSVNDSADSEMVKLEEDVEPDVTGTTSEYAIENIGVDKDVPTYISSSKHMKDVSEKTQSSEDDVNEDKCCEKKRTLSITRSVESNTSRKYMIQRHFQMSKSKSFIVEKQLTNSRKTSVLMILISSTYIISFVPHLLIMFIREIQSDFSDMSVAGRVIYAVFLRSYFINFAANPVIYCLYGSNFRSECKTLFKSWFKRKQKNSTN